MTRTVAAVKLHGSPAHARLRLPCLRSPNAHPNHGQPLHVLGNRVEGLGFGATSDLGLPQLVLPLSETGRSPPSASERYEQSRHVCRSWTSSSRRSWAGGPMLCCSSRTSTWPTQPPCWRATATTTWCSTMISRWVQDCAKPPCLLLPSEHALLLSTCHTEPVG